MDEDSNQLDDRKRWNFVLIVSGISLLSSWLFITCFYVVPFEKVENVKTHAILNETMLEYYLASDIAMLTYLNRKVRVIVGNESSGCPVGGVLRETSMAGLERPCSYERDWMQMLGRLRQDKDFIFPKPDTVVQICEGDCNSMPVVGTLALSKSRRLLPNGMKNGTLYKTLTLLPLNTPRHFADIQSGLRDIVPFRSKLPMAVWRGVTTGNVSCWKRGAKLDDSAHAGDLSSTGEQGCARWNLVVRWATARSRYVDVGISKFAQSHGWPSPSDKWDTSMYKKHRKRRMPMWEMLAYRYIISVEGNDVATNLKWAMASNSVVIMPRPRVETFFAEGLLIEYVHYVPIKDDCSDLVDKVLWCEARRDKCRGIAEAATQYAKNFRDVDTVLDWGSIVLEKHLNKLNV